MVFKCNLTMIVSLQSKHNFGKGVLSIFLVKIIATMMVAEGWVEKEICTKEVSDKRKERGICGTIATKMYPSWTVGYNL